MPSSDYSGGNLPGIAALMKLPPWDGSNLSPLIVPQKILSLLGDPQDAVPTIHVAGTNGKGTVCSSLASIAHASGQKVGQFASPHLNDVCERCLLDGEPVSPLIFDQALQRVFSVMEDNELTSSYFVVGSVATFLVFAETQVDLAIVEVGLGGRYDATNVMHSPQACVITGVSLDHTHILGETIEEISWNKAGIMKSNIPCFLGQLDAIPLSVCEKEAAAVACNLSLYVEGEEEGITLENPLFDSAFQKRNAALASRVASALAYSSDCITRGLESTRWPGRMERLSVKRSSLARALDLDGSEIEVSPALADDELHFLLDAAHNQQGLSATLEYVSKLVQREEPKRIFILSSILERKQWQVMRDTLIEFREGVSSDSSDVTLCFARSSHEGSIDPDKLGSSSNSRSFASTDEALEFVAQEAGRDDLIVCLGSIFFLADVRPKLGAPSFSSIERDSSLRKR
jgi:folylpolyglutamate synthase/dihydrofolate synthase